MTPEKLTDLGFFSIYEKRITKRKIIDIAEDPPASKNKKNQDHC